MIPTCSSVAQKWMYCVALLNRGIDIFFFSLAYSNVYVVDSRWEEERYTDGVKWKFLEHKGPVFAPPYEPLPSNVKFYYDGKTVSHWSP